MKHSGNVAEYTEERDAALFKCFLLIRNADPSKMVTTCFMEAVSMPAPRFFIGETRAYAVVSALRKGAILNLLSPPRRRMFEEIARRVDILMKENPSTDLMQAVVDVINAPAPEFYITPGRCCKLIYRQFHRLQRGGRR